MVNCKIISLTTLLAIGLAAFCAEITCCQESTKSIPVVLRFTNQKWQLFRGGSPYYIKGAGGSGSLQLLADVGGNATRTWGIGPNTMKRLDEAHAAGISVVLGIWLEHENRGYDYQDYDQVTEQITRVLKAVRKYKNHPAVLMWGVGNEMEGYEAGDNPAIWHHVNHICRLIKEEDPNHPTMTVIAEIGGRRVPAIHKFCPHVDIIGINSYGGAATLPSRYKQAGGSKPYVVTEFGPQGPWETDRSRIGAVIEPPSNVKAKQYMSSYLGFTADETHCLGSFAFLWGQKMEATASWFGMLLADGRQTNMVETMSELWTGKAPKNLAPQIRSLTNAHARHEVDPGEKLEFHLEYNEPNGDSVEVEWQLLPEADAYITAGDFKPTPAPIPNAINKSSKDAAHVTAPAKSGLYRLYVIVNDSLGLVATANIAFSVKHQPLSSRGFKVTLPCTIYDDATQQSNFTTIVRSGDLEKSCLDLCCNDKPKFGETCIRWTAANQASAAIKRESSADLMGASRLTFWAKGTTGKEQLRVGIGNSQSNSGETFGKEKTVLLTKHWKKFQLDFANADLRKIRTGFHWTMEPDKNPAEIFLDKVVIE